MLLKLSLKDDSFLDIPFSELHFEDSSLFVTPLDSDVGIWFPLNDIFHFSISPIL